MNFTYKNYTAEPEPAAKDRFTLKELIGENKRETIHGYGYTPEQLVRKITMLELAKDNKVIPLYDISIEIRKVFKEVMSAVNL